MKRKDHNRNSAVDWYNVDWSLMLRKEKNIETETKIIIV